MARRVFYSFHFANDFWRTQQVRNMNILEGQMLCSPNDWEEVKRKGDESIKKWVDDQLHGKTCVVVLVGSETGKPILGVARNFKGVECQEGSYRNTDRQVAR